MLSKRDNTTVKYYVVDGSGAAMSFDIEDIVAARNERSRLEDRYCKPMKLRKVTRVTTITHEEAE